jgi:Rab proteins geranylgeranyltransferase component A
MNDLPSEFDLVVIGTGFQESVIAAAASRIGKIVLHIDENDFYGGFWSSFNLENFINHLDKRKGDNNACRIKNAYQKWFEFTEEVPDILGWNKENILKESRRFNIDIIPKVKKNIANNNINITNEYPLLA